MENREFLSVPWCIPWGDYGRVYGICTVNLGLWWKIPSVTYHQMRCPGRINLQFRELLLTWNGVVCLSAKIG